MYFEAVEWIRQGGALHRLGGALPGGHSAELIAALSQTTYSFRGDRLLLEPKEQVKQRLGYSPDDADAFALTFAQPVQRKPAYADRTREYVAMRQRRRGHQYIHEYGPLEPLPNGGPGFTIHDYDPFEEA